MRDSRVLVFSQRNIERPMWQSLSYEFEDLLTTLDDVHLLSPPAQRAPVASSASRRAVNGAKHRLGLPRRSPLWVTPSMRPTTVLTDHDLFFAVFPFPPQISHLERLKGWRDRCRRAVCVVTEVYTPEVESNADYLRLLADFDEVFVGNPAVGPGMQALGLPAPSFMAPAVDAVRASPQPLHPPRVLDVYNYGRTVAAPHASLLRLVEQRGLTYLYETRGDAAVPDHMAHRALLANMMKRSKFFLAYRVNDSPERRARTGGDEVLSTRFFEGVAGGAVLLGSRTRSPEFDEAFDWPDAVVPVPYDEADMEPVLRALSADPDRLAGIRTANVRNALRRHDWSYRWRQVLDAAGLAASPRLEERTQVLQALAEEVDLPGEGLTLPGERGRQRGPATGADGTITGSQ